MGNTVGMVGNTVGMAGNTNTVDIVVEMVAKMMTVKNTR